MLTERRSFMGGGYKGQDPIAAAIFGKSLVGIGTRAAAAQWLVQPPVNARRSLHQGFDSLVRPNSSHFYRTVLWKLSEF